MSLETSAPATKKTTRDAPIEEHGSAMAINLRTIPENAAEVVRNRMISEYNNTALVSALFLTMMFPVLVAPPEFDVNKDSLRFRIFMYACTISVCTLSFAVLTSVTLSYNLNMMPTEKELGEFIRKISQLGPGLSVNGLPDHLIVSMTVGMMSALLAAITSLHIQMKPIDAWILTALLFCLGYFPAWALANALDGWKWKIIQSTRPIPKHA